MKKNKLLLSMALIALLAIPTKILAISMPTVNVTLANQNQFWGDSNLTIDTQDEDNNPQTIYKLHIQADFGSVLAENGVKINGTQMNFQGGSEEVDFFLEAPENNKFEVVLTYDENGGPILPFSIISWAYTKKACEEAGFTDEDEICDSLLENGTFEVIKAKLPDGTIVTKAEMMEKDEDEPKNPDAFLDITDKTGYAQFAPGTELTVKFIPNRGYQLTKLQINDVVLKAAKEQSTFTFEIAEGTLHLSALFTKVEDVVKSSTDKVKSGFITVDENEISTGSTILSVNDITLTDEKKKIFNEKAGDYKVSTVLDIKLDQVIYKGKSTDVWSNALGHDEDLKTPATITLKLEDGVDGNEVVLVHEKNDGTYEIIDTEYDPKTNTITFKTSSFSNYAIAAKEIKNPQTSDSIINFIISGLMSLVALTVIIKNKKAFN